MAAFKIGHFRLVSSLDQGLEAGFDQVGKTAAEHALLAKKVGFGFFAECCFNNAAPCAANAFGVCQGQLETVAAGILLHGNKAGHAAAFNVGSAHQMARALGGDHQHIYIVRGQNLAEMNVEAMREKNGLALFQVWLDVVFINGALGFVWRENHDHVGLGCCFRGGDGRKAVFPGKVIIGGSRSLPNDNLDAGITQI